MRDEGRYVNTTASREWVRRLPPVGMGEVQRAYEDSMQRLRRDPPRLIERITLKDRSCVMMTETDIDYEIRKVVWRRNLQTFICLCRAVLEGRILLEHWR